MKWFLTICSIFAFASGPISAYLGHPEILFVSTIGFVILIFVANLDRISEFKASRDGIEARTREVVARAESAVSELQLLAVQVAELPLSLVKRQGRWGGYSDEEEEAIRKSVITVLSKLKIPNSEMESVLKEWHRIVEFDYSHHILGGSSIPNNAAPEVLSEWKAMREGGIAKFPSPQEIMSFLVKNDYLTHELDELIKDYQFYCVNRSHKRPEMWQQRLDWGQLKKL